MPYAQTCLFAHHFLTVSASVTLMAKKNGGGNFSSIVSSFAEITVSNKYDKSVVSGPRFTHCALDLSLIHI